MLPSTRDPTIVRAYSLFSLSLARFILSLEMFGRNLPQHFFIYIFSYRSVDHHSDKIRVIFFPCQFVAPDHASMVYAISIVLNSTLRSYVLCLMYAQAQAHDSCSTILYALLVSVCEWVHPFVPLFLLLLLATNSHITQPRAYYIRADECRVSIRWANSSECPEHFALPSDTHWLEDTYYYWRNWVSIAHAKHVQSINHNPFSV